MQSDAKRHNEDEHYVVELDPRHESLMTAVEGSYKGMEWARNLMLNLVKDYHGPAYGSNTHVKERPVNKLNQAIDVWTMLLAANRPRIAINTNYEVLKPFARHYEQAVNNMLTEIHLEETLRRWVLDAFFMVGIIKTHLKDSAPVQFENDLWMDPGTPYASNILLDDFVFDAGAKKWSEVKFAGDIYRIPFSDIKAGVENGMYDAEVAQHLTPNSKYRCDDQDRLEKISTGEVTDEDEFEPMIDLCDIWVARDQKVYTFAVKDRSTFALKKLPPLAVMDWTDPNCGPYHLLGFNEVPGNIMPLSPISTLQALDRTANAVMSKLMAQALRQKENPVYSPAGKETMQAIKDAPDGWAIKGDPKEIGLWQNPGPNQANQAFLLLLLELINNLGGNIDGIAGLGPQAKTVGQEQMIADASNRKVGQMQSRVVEATTALVRSLGFMLWEDQFKEITSQFTVAGYPVESTWKPGDREGNFHDYNFSIVVYSMTYKPPAAEAEALIGLLERVFIPLLQPLMAQGGNVDFAALSDSLAEKMDLDDLRRLVTFMTPPPQEPLSPQHDLKGSPVTTRHNVRHNVSQGATPQSRLQEMQQNLQGSPDMGGVTQLMGGGA